LHFYRTRVKRSDYLAEGAHGYVTARWHQGAQIHMNETLKVNGIDVLVEGEGSETIVMIHGWPDTYRLWDAQVEFFSKRYRCVRFTLPGFETDKPRRAFSLVELIDAVRKIVEEACPAQKVILMLHDWGCVFGYQFCMRHPSLVAKIVGVDIGDAPSRRYVKSLNMNAKIAILKYQVWLAIAWRVGPRIGDGMTKYMARTLKAPMAQQFVGSCMNYPYYIQWTGAHGSYRRLMDVEPPCPMLFIYGKRKPFLFHSPQWADGLFTRPDCQVLAFETGHWVMREDPQRFNKAVEAWLTAT
jgi:pimeloyl-ACP methyl ester carboxylesterase